MGAWSGHERKFTEPVALSSTPPADLPLPRRAFRLSFDLVTLRARCVEEPMGEARLGQARSQSDWRSLRPSSNQEDLRRTGALSRRSRHHRARVRFVSGHADRLRLTLLVLCRLAIPAPLRPLFDRNLQAGARLSARGRNPRTARGTAPDRKFCTNRRFGIAWLSQTHAVDGCRNGRCRTRTTTVRVPTSRVVGRHLSLLAFDTTVTDLLA